MLVETRKSRAHAFVIGYTDDVPDGEEPKPGQILMRGQHIVDLMVTITFQGVFGARGYRPGRLAASLTRLPPDDDPGALPVRRRQNRRPPRALLLGS